MLLAIQISGLAFYLSACFMFVLGFITCGVVASSSDRKEESKRLKQIGDCLAAMLAVSSRFVHRAKKEDGDLFWRLGARALKMTDLNEPEVKMKADEIECIRSIQNAIDVRA